VGVPISLPSKLSLAPERGGRDRGEGGWTVRDWGRGLKMIQGISTASSSRTQRARRRGGAGAVPEWLPL
jgi:hypothetical protein